MLNNNDDDDLLSACVCDVSLGLLKSGSSRGVVTAEVNQVANRARCLLCLCSNRSAV